MGPKPRKTEAPFEKMAAPFEKMAALNFQTAPPFGKMMLNLIKTKRKMKKKTTFNRKGLINETANVTALRKMRISYYTLRPKE